MRENRLGLDWNCAYRTQILLCAAQATVRSLPVRSSVGLCRVRTQRFIGLYKLVCSIAVAISYTMAITVVK